MKQLFNLLIAFSLIMGVSSCGPAWKARHQETDTTMGVSMKGVEYIYKGYQVDSMCVADTLSNVDTWLKTTFYDYETGKQLTKKMYIKEYMSDSEIIYTLLPYQDSLFRVTVRTVKGE